ncbi:MAG: phosphoglucosamine mutase [Candidatus Babeliales bacterium]
METRNLFGTDGIRTAVGSSPFTHHELPQLGKAIAAWTHAHYGNNPRILLAHDTRQSCAWVKSSLQSGLLLSPVKIFDAGVVTSPVVSQLLHYTTDYDCGIVISASHNSYEDNGIKLIDAHTGKLSQQAEEQITQLFFAQSNHEPDYTVLGTQTVLTAVSQNYQEHITPFFEPKFLQGLKIVLDCAHGAAWQLAPALFKHYGACVVALHNAPNGININKQSGAVYPQALQKAVVSHHADIGFAFDGDGDRVICVNKHGQLKNGDDVLALLLAHPTYKETKTVVGTSMTNQGFENYLLKQNKTLIRANVGDKYVWQEMVKRNLPLGGEPSGHIITRDYLPTGDGIFNALRVMQAILNSDNVEMTTFTKYPQVIINVPVMRKPKLDTEPLASLIAASDAQIKQGRIIVRYSGTEPLLRIMIEEEHFEQAQAIGSQLAQKLKKNLSN